MSAPTHYEALGVDPGANPREIRAAFERLSSFFDAGSLAVYALVGADAREEEMGRIREAFRILSDPDARAAYDESLGLDTGEIELTDEDILSSVPLSDASSGTQASPPAAPLRGAPGGPRAEPAEDAASEGAASDSVVGSAAVASTAGDAASAASAASFADAAPAATAGSPSSGASSAGAAPTAEAASAIDAASLVGATPAPSAPAPPSAIRPAGPSAAASGEGAAAGSGRGTGPAPEAVGAAASPQGADIVAADAGAGAPEPEAAPAESDASGEPTADPLRIDEDTEFTGALLRALREAKGFTLKDISARTRIGAGHLHNIEEEAFDLLPERVFLRGFVLSYARELKLDATRVADSYLRRRNR
ncbi:MAG TPA: helix-turn-helix domain-containing protein [Vulgatibacter sp.]|nr:helix-turn-helix domain-containing protein [Vulgatibacter sp.]